MATARGGPNWRRSPAELSLGQAVRFLGTRSDVPEVLSLIDVLVLTSHMEANPVSILEAMAAEKPVVATRVGSVSETVLDGATGYLVAPGDADELAARLIELLRDRQRAAVMGRAGREHVLDHWSIERMVAGYEDLLEGIYPPRWGLGIWGWRLQGPPDTVRGLFKSPAPSSQPPVPSPQPPAPSPQPPVRLRWETGSRFRVAPVAQAVAAAR